MRYYFDVVTTTEQRWLAVGWPHWMPGRFPRTPFVGTMADDTATVVGEAVAGVVETCRMIASVWNRECSVVVDVVVSAGVE